MAVAASAAIATVVDAAPAPQASPTWTLVAPPARAETAALVGPVVVPSVEAPQTVSQTIALSVIGGPLELMTPNVDVPLARVPSSTRDWVAALPPVRLIDARGTFEGWDVRWEVAGVDLQGGDDLGHALNALIRLDPTTPTVVAGTPQGLAGGPGGTARPDGRSLFSAQPGSGGGTYENSGVLSIRLPSELDADAVVVHLAFSLG